MNEKEKDPREKQPKCWFFETNYYQKQTTFLNQGEEKISNKNRIPLQLQHREIKEKIKEYYDLSYANKF